jgi:small GTP-binding protein
MTHEIDYILKLLIIGDANVGKTTYFNKIQNNTAYFSGSTIGVDFTKMYYTIRDKHVNVIIWDTAGQERFQSVVRSYFRDTCGAVLMFDISNPLTWQRIEYWLKTLLHDQKCSHEHPILLLGNKSDLPNLIDSNEIQRVVKEYNLIYREISCKINEQSYLEEIFTSFIGKILDSDHIEDCYGIKMTTDKSHHFTLNDKHNYTAYKREVCCNIV